jgi:hypothetical protein
MQKNWIVVLSAAVLMGLVLSGCASATQAPQAPAEVQPPQQPEPVQVQPTQGAQAPAEPAAQTFAPVCQTGASGCSAPVVANEDANDGYCVKKIRYHNILVPPGTTFEPIDSTGDFKCFDQNQVEDGMNVISCTGDQLISYQLKLTNSSCGGGSNLQTGTGQCQDGYGFDATNQCCAALDSGSGGSTTITVNIGACPGPQSN